MQSFIAKDVLELLQKGTSVAEIMKQYSGPFYQPISQEDYGSWEPGKLQKMQAATEKFKADFATWAVDMYGSVGAYYQAKVDEHGPVGDI